MAESHDSKVSRILARFNEAKAQRAYWDSLYQDVADYINPTRSFSSHKTPGREYSAGIFDDSAREARVESASAIHGLMNNPATRWMSVRAADPRIDDMEHVRGWMQFVTGSMFDEINSRGFMFDVNSYEIYSDMVSFGTGFASFETTRGRLRLVARPLQEMYPFDDFGDGQITTVYRYFELTARQAVEKFGHNNVAPSVAEKADQPSRCDDKLWYVHEVSPRFERDVNRSDPMNKAYSSIVVDEANKRIVREHGFDRFPYFGPRWSKAPGELLGRGPGTEVIATVRMANALAETLIAGAEKVIDPPLQVPANALESPIRTTPGGVTYYRSGMKEPISPLGGTDANRIAFGVEFYDRTVATIRRMFHLDVLGPLPIIDRQTGVEVMARLQQRAQSLSPIVARIKSEFLEPFLENLFFAMLEQGRFPAPPREVMQSGMRIEFTSPLAASQRSGEIAALQQHLTLLAPLAQASPDILTNYDTDAIARRTAGLLNVPQWALRSEQERDAIRQAAAQQQQQIEQAQAAKVAAEAADSGASAIERLQLTGSAA